MTQSRQSVLTIHPSAFAIDIPDRGWKVFYRIATGTGSSCSIALSGSHDSEGKAWDDAAEAVERRKS